MYEYSGTLIRVVDGDTVVLSLTKKITLEVDFGFYVKVAEVDFRLKGINTPEIRGETKERGIAAKAHLLGLLSAKPLRVVSYKTDKYGRWLAEIFVTVDGVEKSVNQLMIDDGYAVPYMTT